MSLIQNSTFIALFIIILSSCGSTYDMVIPKADEKRRSYIYNTYNYEDLRQSEDWQGKNFVTDLNTEKKSVLQVKNDVSSTSDGKISNSSLNEFGPFESYINVNKSVSVKFNRSKTAMKGFKKISQTYTAKNHKPKTVKLKKQIRIGAAIGNIFPLYGVGFFFEKGHLWKMKKNNELVLEPTEEYKNYCKQLSVLADLITEKRSCAESKEEIQIQDSWVVDVNYYVFSDKKYINNYTPQSMNYFYPKKPITEISQSHVDEVEKSINTIQKQKTFFASKNNATVYYDMIMSAEKKEKEEARQRALASAYSDFLNKEVICNDNKGNVIQKEAWIISVEDKPISNSSYGYLLRKDDKIEFEYKNIGTITTKSIFENNFYSPNTPTQIYDYESKGYSLFCSKESAKEKIKQIQQEQNLEIAKRKKEKEDKFKAWLNEEVVCSDNEDLKKKKYTWVIIKKKGKRYPYKVRDVNIDNYQNMMSNLYTESLLTTRSKYRNRIYFSSESKAKTEIKNRAEDAKQDQLAENKRIEAERIKKAREAEIERKRKAREKPVYSEDSKCKCYLNGGKVKKKDKYGRWSLLTHCFRHCSGCSLCW